MCNLKVSFVILPDGKTPTFHYRKVSGYLILYVRMMLERKVRWFKDGHKTPQPDWSTFVGLLSLEIIIIALIYYELNDLQVFVSDIKNSYLQSPLSVKHYIICVTEFGLDNEGKMEIIFRALYGGKSYCNDSWRHVQAAMVDMKF